jgi:hypothetical protein
MNPRLHPRKKFTPGEDTQLMNLVMSLGTNSWEEIVKHFPNRNLRQVRERYTHYLSCPNNFNPWTDYEDMLLQQKVFEYGNKWTKLQFFFPGRSDIRIKARWGQLCRRAENTYQSLGNMAGMGERTQSDLGFSERDWAEVFPE